jgi:hypothetical protein
MDDLLTGSFVCSLVEGRHHGRAIEGDVFPSPEAVGAHLINLIQESKKQVRKWFAAPTRDILSEEHNNIGFQENCQ